MYQLYSQVDVVEKFSRMELLRIQLLRVCETEQTKFAKAKTIQERFYGLEKVRGCVLILIFAIVYCRVLKSCNLTRGRVNKNIFYRVFLALL